MNNLISIIIPSYNSHQTIEVTLSKIFEMENLELLKEVIVVDSSDDKLTKSSIAKFESKGVQCITSGVRVIPAIQRNIGAKHANGEVLAFIDSDAYPDIHWLKNISRLYAKGVKVGGGAYLVPEFQQKKKIVFAQYYLEFSEFLPWGKQRGKGMTPSCNLFCSKELFIEVGGFPEIRASEDSLFGLKVSKKTDLIFDPTILVYHIFRENLEHYLLNQKLLGQYIYEYRKTQKKYFQIKWIVISSLPLVLVFKFSRIYFRVARIGVKHLVSFHSCLPIFWKGFKNWTIGYLQGVKNS